MHKFNANAGIPELQRCYSIENFVRAINDEILLPLAKAMDDTPDRPDRSGRKRDRLLQIIVFYLYFNYPGAAEARSVEELCRRLKEPNDELVRLLIFDRVPPSQNTVHKWTRRMDDHPELVKAALHAISEMMPWVPPSGQTQKKTDQPTKQSSTRTAKINRYIKLREDEALGDEQFLALYRRDAEHERSTEEAACDDLILEWAHNNDLQCPKCRFGDCSKQHDHVVVERPRTRTGRRRWRCRCCRSNLSVTAGTLLHGLKTPLKTILRCLYYMVRERRGISAMQMAGYFNLPGKNMRIATILKLMHRIRAAMVEPPPIFEGGTEIDEAVVTLSDGSKAHLIGAYNRRTRRVYIEVLEGRATKSVMRDFINRVTAPGSTIYTDGDAAVPREGPDRDTERTYYWVNHSKFEWTRHVDLGEDDPRGLWSTVNHIEGGWGFLKRSLRLRVSISRHHLHRYLAEVMWRINYLSNRAEAESYQGQERRELALMKQLVAGMVGTRITEKELRGPKVEPARQKQRQPPLSPRGRTFLKSDHNDNRQAIPVVQSQEPSEAPVEYEFQTEMSLVRERSQEEISPDQTMSDRKTHRRRFAAQLELPLEDPVPEKTVIRQTA